MNDKPYLALSWIATGAGWVLTHFSSVAVIAASLIAASASYYSFRINRRKDRQMRASDEHACSECKRTMNPFQCPYPESERPETCWLRREIEAQRKAEL